MEEFSPKIEIINHFDNLINRIDIDIEDSLEKYDDAISISQQVINIAQRLGSKEDLKFSYVNLKEAFEAKKDYKSANDVLNKLMASKTV